MAFSPTSPADEWPPYSFCPPMEECNFLVPCDEQPSDHAHQQQEHHEFVGILPETKHRKTRGWKKKVAKKKSQKIKSVEVANNLDAIEENKNGIKLEEDITTKNEEESQKRLGGINGAFMALRKRIPTFPFEKRLSKIDTLNLACAYINMLELIATEEPPGVFLERSIRAAKDGINLTQSSSSYWITSDLLARLHWINWPAIGMESPILA